MSASKADSVSEMRQLRTVVFLVCAMFWLLPSFALTQGAPKTVWFQNPLAYINQVAYSPDGTLVAVVGGNGDWGVVELRKASTGQVLQSLRTTASNGVNSLAFSPDGKTLAAAGGNLLEFWNVSNGTLIRSFQSAATAVASIAFSPDGTTLADGGYNDNGGIVELRSVSTGKLVQSLNSAANGVTVVAFSPDGTIIADGGSYISGYVEGVLPEYQGVLELWSVSTGKLVQSLNTSASQVNSVAFSPDGTTLALGGNSSGYDQIFNPVYVGILELWSASTGKLVQSLFTDANNIYSVTFSPEGKTLADGGDYVDNGDQSVLEVWTVATGQRVQSLNTAAGLGPVSVAFSPDGKTLADAGATYTGGVLECWNVSTGTLLLSLNTTNDSITSVAFSPDGNILAEGGDSVAYPNSQGFVNLWNASTGTLLVSLQSTANVVTSTTFSPDGNTLADGGVSFEGSQSNGVLELWSVSKGKVLLSLNTAAHPVNSVAFSPDGKILADAGSNGSSGVLELWNVATGKLLASLKTAANSVSSVAFSPDGRTLADAGDISGYDQNGNPIYQGALELWNVSTGKLIASLKTAANSVSSLAFSPDSKTLADGGDISGYDQNGNPIYQGVLELWNVATGTLIASLNTEESKGVSSVAFAPDGKTLAAGGSYTDSIGVDLGGVLELWNVATGSKTLYYDQFVGHLSSVGFSPNGQYLAYGSGGGLLAMADNPLFNSLPTYFFVYPTTSGPTGAPVLLTALLKSGANYAPIPQQTIQFTVNGVPVGNATTGANGEADLWYRISNSLNVGSYTTQASFSGNATFKAASANGTLTVVKGDTSFTVTTAAKGKRGDTVQFTIRLVRQSDGKPVSNVKVTFAVDGNVIGVATTDTTGVARVNYTIPPNAPLGWHGAQVQFGGDGNYSGCNGLGSVTVTS